MKVFIFPKNIADIHRATVTSGRRAFIRALLTATRREEIFSSTGVHLFTVQNAPSPLNMYAVSPGGFLYLPCEWLPRERLRSVRTAPTMILKVQTSAGLLATRRFLPAWLVYALATDGTHASRILTYAHLAKQSTEALNTEEVVFNA